MKMSSWFNNITIAAFLIAAGVMVFNNTPHTMNAVAESKYDEQEVKTKACYGFKRVVYNKNGFRLIKEWKDKDDIKFIRSQYEKYFDGRTIVSFSFWKHPELPNYVANVEFKYTCKTTHKVMTPRDYLRTVRGIEERLTPEQLSKKINEEKGKDV